MFFFFLKFFFNLLSSCRAERRPAERRRRSPKLHLHLAFTRVPPDPSASPTTQRTFQCSEDSSSSSLATSPFQAFVMKLDVFCHRLTEENGSFLWIRQLDLQSRSCILLFYPEVCIKESIFFPFLQLSSTKLVDPLSNIR